MHLHFHCCLSEHSRQQADEGWTFAYWTDDNGEIVSYDAEYTFEVKGDVILTAVFAEDEAQPTEPEDNTKFQAGDPRKETDIIIVPDDDDDNNGGSPDGGADLSGGNGGEGAGRMTPQEAIATLNNLLTMCGTVTRG